MPCFNDICWTSWKCSYSRHSKYDGTIGKRCGLPDSVYTPENDGAQGYTLVWEEKYLMEWTSNFASQNEDIVLEWLIYEAPGTESTSSTSNAVLGSPLTSRTAPILFNETDLYPDYTGKGPEKFVVAHSQSEYPSLAHLHKHSHTSQLSAIILLVGISSPRCPSSRTSTSTCLLRERLATPWNVMSSVSTTLRPSTLKTLRPTT